MKSATERLSNQSATSSNIVLEPTPYSLRFAAASSATTSDGRGVRKTKAPTYPAYWSSPQEPQPYLSGVHVLPGRWGFFHA